MRFQQTRREARRACPRCASMSNGNFTRELPEEIELEGSPEVQYPAWYPPRNSNQGVNCPSIELGNCSTIYLKFTPRSASSTISFSLFILLLRSWLNTFAPTSIPRLRAQLMKSLPDSAQTAQTILESPCRFALSEVAYYFNLVCQKVNIDSTIDLGPCQVPFANFECLAKK